MGVEQIIVLSLMGLNLLVSANQHGKEVKQNIYGALIGVGIMVFLLVSGGFFK
jgi:hypothetical protein